MDISKVEHRIKLIRKSACIMLTKNNEYIDSIFFNRYDFDSGNVSKDQIRFEASKLAATNNVNEYVFDNS